MDVLCYNVYRSMIHLIVDYGQLKYSTIPTETDVIMKLTFDKDQTELHIFYWFNWQPLKTNQQKPLCVRCTSDPNVFYWESSTMYHGPLHSYFETTHKLVRNTLFRWNKLENSKWLNMSWWKTNGSQIGSLLHRSGQWPAVDGLKVMTGGTVGGPDMEKGKWEGWKWGTALLGM